MRQKADAEARHPEHDHRKASREHPDGHFPTCPYPNPEIRQAMELGAFSTATASTPDILIGTDPDCDRCGTAVPDGKGGYRLISGNEMGVILLDFICRSRIANGTMPENPSLSPPLSRPIWSQLSPKIRRRAAPRAYGFQIYRRGRSPCWSRAAIRALYLRL